MRLQWSLPKANFLRLQTAVSKILNILLLILIAVGMVMLVNAKLTGRQLKSEYDRLAAEYGTLPVVDEEKFLLTFQPGEMPTRSFKWRMYFPQLPDGFKSTVKSPNRSSDGLSSTPSSQQARIVCKFRVSDGEPELYWSIAGKSSVNRFNKKLHPFLIEHWDKLDFRVLAESSNAEVPISEKLRVLTIRIPKSLFDQLPDDLNANQLKSYKTKPLFEIILGEKTTMETLP